MKIAATPPRNPPPPAPQEESFWREFGHDVREVLLHADPDKLHDLGNLVKNVGLGFRGIWSVVRHLPGRLFNHEIVKDNVDADTRQDWVDLSEKVGLIAGLTAAGGQAVLGCGKLVSGFKHHHTGRKLDGLVDLATATTLGLTVAGLGAARLVVAPIAASINVLRGGYNTLDGFRHNDERKQLQGLLDVSRSIGGLGRIFRRVSPLGKVVGIALAPVAGALQAGRGVHDIAVGLKNDDKKRMVRGMVDMATAVGTTMAFASGVAVIPGVVLAVAANVGKVAYQVSPKFRGWVDRRIDKHQPKLEALVRHTDRCTASLRKGWKSLMGKLIDHTDPHGPDTFSRAQLADIGRLLHEDGHYSREEQQRLRVALEEVGQAAQTPALDAGPPESLRPQLIQELVSPTQRKEFVGFMLAVADYQAAIAGEEEAYCRQLAHDLNIPDAEFDQMLHDQLSQAKDSP